MNKFLEIQNNRILSILLMFLTLSISFYLISLSYKTFSYQANFELAQLGEMRRDQFLLDKNSGRIWKKVCYGETANYECKGILVWEEMFATNLTESDSYPSKKFIRYIKNKASEEEAINK